MKLMFVPFVLNFCDSALAPVQDEAALLQELNELEDLAELDEAKQFELSLPSVPAHKPVIQQASQVAQANPVAAVSAASAFKISQPAFS